MKSRIYSRESPPARPHGRRGVSIRDVSTAAAPRPLAHRGPGLDAEGQDRLGDLLVVVARAGLLLTFSLEGDALRLRGQVALRAHPTPTERAIGGLLHLVGGGPFAALHVALRQPAGAPTPSSRPRLRRADRRRRHRPRPPPAGGRRGHRGRAGGGRRPERRSRPGGRVGRDGRLRTIDLARSHPPARQGPRGARLAPPAAARIPPGPDLLFAALWDDPGGLGVFDLSEPARPAVHGLLLHPDLARANRVALARDRAWLPLERSPGGVAGVDVRDPAHPRLAHLLVGIPGIDTPYTLAASGDFLYVFSSRAPKMVVLEVPRGGLP
ncbi:MAG: hypothetical protein R3F60_17045 [bacterium]